MGIGGAHATDEPDSQTRPTSFSFTSMQKELLLYNMSQPQQNAQLTIPSGSTLIPMILLERAMRVATSFCAFQ
eukprot:3480087-Amphidinium_carterae.1